jgi:hypothetical protein
VMSIAMARALRYRMVLAMRFSSAFADNTMAPPNSLGYRMYLHIFFEILLYVIMFGVRIFSRWCGDTTRDGISIVFLWCRDFRSGALRAYYFVLRLLGIIFVCGGFLICARLHIAFRRHKLRADSCDVFSTLKILCPHRLSSPWYHSTCCDSMEFV